MKQSILAAILFAVAATAQAEPYGSYLTWMGFNAGNAGNGNYSTMYGSFSGANSSGMEGSSFMGVMSGYYTSDLIDCFGAGFRALQDATYSSNVCAIGRNAGRGANYLHNCFFVGNGAGRDTESLTNCVFIGRDAGRGVSNLADRTYINGQFYADRASGTFYIRPTPGSDQDALTYSNGVLKIGAKVLSRHNERVGFTASLYLSEDGDDANDGLTLATAKRTIAATVAAANAMGTSNIVVAVLDGDYTTPFSDFGANSTLTFRSVNGKETTRIVGGLNAVVSWSSHSCIWQGFTFTGFVGQGFMSDNARVCRFGAMAFEDCDFVDNAFEAEEDYTAYQLCDFVRCRFYRNKYYIRDWNAVGALGIIFRSCNFYASTIDGMEIYNIGGAPNTSYAVIWSDIAAERCLFKLPCTYIRYNEYRGKPQYRFRDVTIVAPSVHRKEFNNNSWNVTNGHPYPMGQSVTNCFYVIGDFAPGTVYRWCGTAATNCIPDRFVACASADLTDDCVANDEDCPSVRDDGKRDYGWKTTAFGAFKYARLLEARLAAVPEVLRIRDPASGNIYQFSVADGELSVSSVSNEVQTATRLLATRGEATTAGADEDEDEPGTETVMVGRYIVVRRKGDNR